MAKFIYMDEAGTDHGSPVTVVAGVVVDPDKQWNATHQFLEKFKEQLPDLPEDWVLHATELFSGGKTLIRDKYGKDIRFPVLEALFGLPRFLGLPIFFSDTWKGEKKEDWDPATDAWFRHVMAFTGAVKAANSLMAKSFPDELATLTAEDVPQNKQLLSSIPVMLRMAGVHDGVHHFDRIVDTPNFANKQGAPHLVIADALAFAVRLYLSGHKDGPWAMEHVFGTDDVELIFAQGRKSRGASYALDWGWFEGHSEA